MPKTKTQGSSNGSNPSPAEMMQSAQRLLQEEAQERARQCGEEIEPILQKYRCMIGAQIRKVPIAENVWGDVAEGGIVPLPLEENEPEV